ncbi:MAG: SCP2 sterol-binding domain-containing protein [Gammaproteobacteria bacterium]
MLPHLERAIAHLLEFDPETRATLAGLEGRTVLLEIAGLDRALYLLPNTKGMTIQLDHEGDSHVRIRCSTGGLVKLARARMRGESVPAGAVDISGDLGTAQDVQNILSRIDIDWEEMVSRVVGDTAARKLGLFARDFSGWLRRTGQSMAMNFSEYVRYEVETVPERDSVERFMRDVDVLRGDADRLAERVRRLMHTQSGVANPARER